MKIWLLIEFLFIGILFAALSIPLIRRKVAPNHWYGFRTPRTLADPNIWYPVNEYFARRSLWIGAATAIASILLYLIPNIAPETYVLSILAILLPALAIATIASFRQIRKLSASK